MCSYEQAVELNANLVVCVLSFQPVGRCWLDRCKLHSLDNPVFGNFDSNQICTTGISNEPNKPHRHNRPR